MDTLKWLKTLDLLVEAGANPAIVDDKGRDAVDVARARRLPTVHARNRAPHAFYRPWSALLYAVIAIVVDFS
jgi:hypothetical protein